VKDAIDSYDNYNLNMQDFNEQLQVEQYNEHKSGFVQPQTAMNMGMNFNINQISSNNNINNNNTTSTVTRLMNQKDEMSTNIWSCSNKLNANNFKKKK
jgi:hypothetical protein